MAIKLDVSNLGDAFAQGCSDVQKAIANAVLDELAVKTPIDTGRAKSNWVVGLNKEGSGPIPAHDPGEKGSTYNSNIDDTVNAGRTQIARAVYSDVINITNNLDYIEKLNNGTSVQAPAGFVEDAVFAGIAATNNVKVLP